MPDPQVAIDRSMAPHFCLPAWKALDDGGKLALGDYLSERLQNHGWVIPEPMVLRQFGPPDELRSVLQWREPASGMTFSFVPGGTFQPGFDKDQMAQVQELIRQDSGELDDEDELPEPDPSFELKAPVEVSPFFLATELVRPNLPELRSVLPPKSGKNVVQFDEFMGDAVEFPWDSVAPVLERFGWSLPTSAEFEWALRGGVSSLFYWGDDFPAFLEFVDVGWEGVSHPDEQPAKTSFDAIMSAAFDPDRPRDWPWCNRFGLAAMLPRQTWCAPSTDPDDLAPLVIRGGAAHFYPWQGGCYEWLMLLNAAEIRLDSKPTDFIAAIPPEAAIRPMIRLKATA